ncbi:lysozyme inhibitor [Pusillimonas sp. ANT_WB101]|nr:lysozyme inhibitor [Pusillimonas sp. ANT_WB101]
MIKYSAKRTPSMNTMPGSVKWITLISATALLSLAACSQVPLGHPGDATSTKQPRPEVIQATYQCEDGSRLSVLFEHETAIVTLPDGQAVRLPQQIAASGFSYASARHGLRGKGDEAQWTVGRRTPVMCRAQP